MKQANYAQIRIARCEALTEHIDDYDIVCQSPVLGEQADHDLLLSLLITSCEILQPGIWNPAIFAKLLTDAEFVGKVSDVWLREKFFGQPAKCFQHSPFIGHVLERVNDGFGALAYYHKLNAKNLELLNHTYLGDWIRKQETGIHEQVDGANAHLTAARVLKRMLELILADEKKDYEFFVRWKPLAEQPLGWNPRLNDGVCFNIRPFMNTEVLPHNKKTNLNITWDKDRGKVVESAPWFHMFNGERINVRYLSLVEKIAARESKT